MTPEDLKNYRADDGFQLFPPEDAGLLFVAAIFLAAFLEWLFR